MVPVAKVVGLSGLAIVAGLLLSAGRSRRRRAAIRRLPVNQSPPLRKTYSRFSSAPVSSATGQARTPPCH